MGASQHIQLQPETTLKGKGSENLNHHQNESSPKTKPFGANFRKIGL